MLFSFLRESMSEDPWDDWETAADAGVIIIIIIIKNHYI
jgi:hypothetical protein